VSPKRKRLAAAVAVIVGLLVVIFLLLPSDPDPPPPPLALIQYVDCTSSMRNVLPGLIPFASAITKDGARPNSLLLAGSFAGPPALSPNPWTVVHHYRLDLHGTGGNKTVAAERVALQGPPQAAKVAEVLTCPRGFHGGSPLLSALEQAAKALRDAHLGPNVAKRVVFYTDGAIVGDGLNSKEGISPQQEAVAIRQFAPRLTGLQGAHVWVIGVGSGTQIDPGTIAVINDLFDKLLLKAGGHLETFSASPAGYPATF
jgi:hypothetical protein